MKKDDRLGRGLGSLLSGSLDLDDEKKEFFRCPVSLISPNPYQPRREMDDAALSQLAESIREKGILQPLVVRELQGNGGYELIAGERRLRAAKRIGLDEVPVIVKEATPEDRLELALIENIQRQNLNPIEEAIAYKRLVDEFHLTQDEVAQKVGKERSTVANIMRLLQLPEYAKNDVADNRLSMGHARVMLGIEDENQFREIRDTIIGQGLSVRRTEEIVAGQKKSQGGKGVAKKQPEKGIPVSYCNTLADEVGRMLGTKSRIVQKGTRGKIEIEYYSLDDLERIHKLLTTVQPEMQ
ncbi:MAG: ParB/RepB/Spo0J family partition protein [Pseudomonadota bacterium]